MIIMMGGETLLWLECPSLSDANTDPYLGTPLKVGVRVESESGDDRPWEGRHIS